MGVTASRETQAWVATGPARLFLGVRPVGAVLVVTVVLGAFTAWLGLVEAPVPTAAHQGTARVPLWRLLTMAAAVLPVLALHSPLAALEAVATRRLHSAQRRYLAGLTVVCAMIFLSGALAVLPPAVVTIMARSWLGWLGLALVAGAVLGWRLAWTLPSATAVALWYWGFQGGEGYRWWEFSARPHDDLASLLLSGALLGVGLAAFAATPWRRRRLVPAR